FMPGAKAAAGAVPAEVLALVETGSRGMFPATVKLAAAALVLGAACLALAVPQAGQKPGNPTLRAPQPAGRAAVDRHGDPLPPRAVARLGTLRFRSDGWVSRVAVVPGGKQVLVRGARAVLLWDAATGRELRRFEGPAWRKGDRGTSYSVRIESF